MDEIKRAKWVFTKKHLWYRDKAGEIDMWCLDIGFHNGPECQICGEAFCEHCHKDWADKECSIGHYECSACSEVSRDGHERFCPGCGANDEKRFPVRKGTVVYVHSKGRHIVAECGGVRETFFPEEVLT